MVIRNNIFFCLLFFKAPIPILYLFLHAIFVSGKFAKQKILMQNFVKIWQYLRKKFRFSHSFKQKI